MTFSVIIVDDEPWSHKVLENHIRQMPQLELKGNFFNAVDAKNYLTGCPVDIILLDIKMPEISGLDFLRSLQVKPITILITAFRDYAIEGFELGVIDYLLKPIRFDRLEIAISRATEFLRLSKSANSIDATGKTDRKDFELLIKNGTKKILIDYRTIVYAQGLKDYTILQTNENKYVVKGSIKSFEDFLPNDFFIRVHKSFMVARDRIKLVHKNKIEIDNIFIPVGRHFKKAVDDFLLSKNGK